MRLHRSLIVALTLFTAVGAFAAQDTIRKGFQVGPGGTLRLDGGFGNVKIVSGGSGVAVEVHRRAIGRDDEERLHEHRIEFRQSGNDVIITSDFENRFGHWFSDYDVQWNIRVPSQYNLEVGTSGGSIELDDIGGKVDVRTSGGSIRTGQLGGPSTLKTSGGSITVLGATGEVTAHTSGGSIDIGDTSGPVEARTSGGSIKLGRINGEVLARTSGGGIRIDDVMGRVDASTSGGSIQATISRQPASDSRLSTSGGGVTVNLASGIGVELDARTSGGVVDTDVPMTIQGTQDKHAISGRINGGGPKLVLRSSGGGIRVRPM